MVKELLNSEVGFLHVFNVYGMAPVLLIVCCNYMYMPTGQWGIHQFIYNYMNLAVSGNSLPSPIQIILQCTVYSCFDKGCPTNLKCMPQCRLIVIAYHCLIEVHGVSARRKGKHGYPCLCYFLLSRPTPCSFNQVT